MTPINPKKREADNHSEDSDERMNIGHFLLNDETYQIIELRDDKGTEYDQSDCLEPVADKCHVYGYGNPYQCRTCHGYDTGKSL